MSRHESGEAARDRVLNRVGKWNFGTVNQQVLEADGTMVDDFATAI